MTYTSLYMATSPVAYWEANEAAGSTSLADASGNGHTATPVGTTTLGKPGLIPGETDTALLLNASGAISCPNLALSPPFSLVGIFQPTGDGGTTTGYGSLFGFGGPSNNGHRVLWADTSNGSRVLVQMGATSLYTPNNSMPAGAVAHVAYTNDGTTESIYINGTLEASQVNHAAVWNSAFYIGSYGPVSPAGAYQLAGTMEKLGVNNTCLSAATIASLSQAALNPPPPPPGVTALAWNGTAWAPTNLQMFVGSQAPAGQNPGDVWIQVTS